jgi:hypothetical protein
MPEAEGQGWGIFAVLNPSIRGLHVFVKVPFLGVAKQAGGCGARVGNFYPSMTVNVRTRIRTSVRACPKCRSGFQPDSSPFVGGGRRPPASSRASIGDCPEWVYQGARPPPIIGTCQVSRSQFLHHSFCFLKYARKCKKILHISSLFCPDSRETKTPYLGKNPRLALAVYGV